MAKVRKPKRQRSRGPYLDAALICEHVVHENDGALSPIRLVNKLTIHEDAPEAGAILHLPLFLLISFKAGQIIGERKFSLYLVTPSGKRTEFLKGAPMTFQGKDTGVVSAVQLHLPYEANGTYWIDVILNQRRYSRVPLTLIYNKQSS